MTQIQIFIILTIIRWYFKFSKLSDAQFKAQWYESWDSYTLDQKIYSVSSFLMVIVRYILLYIVSGWISPYINSLLERM